MMSTPEAAVAAARSGADEILITGDPNQLRPTYDALLKAAQEGQLTSSSLAAANQRIQELKQKVAG